MAFKTMVVFIHSTHYVYVCEAIYVSLGIQIIKTFFSCVSSHLYFTYKQKMIICLSCSPKP